MAIDIVCVCASLTITRVQVPSQSHTTMISPFLDSVLSLKSYGPLTQQVGILITVSVGGSPRVRVYVSQRLSQWICIVKPALHSTGIGLRKTQGYQYQLDYSSLSLRLLKHFFDNVLLENGAVVCYVS